MPFCANSCQAGDLIQVHGRQKTQMEADWRYLCIGCFIAEEHAKYSTIKDLSANISETEKNI